MPHGPRSWKELAAERELLAVRSGELAVLIHDQVLQSLALALLEAELCRRLVDTSDLAPALTELDHVARDIDSAVVTLRQIMNELLHHAGPPGAPVAP